MQPTEPLHDLPEVEMPSAEFIVRLFVIPALIVAGVVGLWLVMGALGGDRADAMTFVRRIREDRGGWRSAYELANLLRTDPETTSDPRLLGELTSVLEAEFGKDAEPRMAEYFALALGAFQIQDARLADGRAIDPIATLARGLDGRRDATIRIASVASLSRHAFRLDGKLDAPGVVGPLGACARAADLPELRRVAVFALGVCGGGEAAEIVRERLRDDPDGYVRDNAALALARRGDAAALDAIRAILARPVIDDPELAETVRLQALAALTKPAAVELLHSVRPQLESLAKSGAEESCKRAQQALKILQ